MKTEACLDQATLERLLQQSLPANQVQLYEDHLAHCAQCQRKIEAIAGDNAWWSDAAVMLSTSDALGLHDTNEPNEDSDSRHARSATLKQVRQILQPPTHPEMLGRLGLYEIESFLGQGGFGVVFKAHDSELNRSVAIKVLAPQLASSGVARRRFAREAQAAAAVVHPNVVPIHAVQSEAEFPYLVMSYVPGCSLQNFVSQNGPMDVKSIVRIAAQVAAGLAAAHRQGLVHRDIKPANILLENGLSRALITDFGLARAADDAAATQTGWLAGTPHYMSPEQARGADLDGRSDLFSLGSVIYFMATGREPFRSEQPLGILQKISTDRPMSPHRINSDIPKQLSRIVDRLLEKRPEDRIQSAAQLCEILEDYLAHLQQPQKRSLPRLPVSPRSWRRSGYGFAAALLIVACVAGGYQWIKMWPTQEATTSIQNLTQTLSPQQSIEAFRALQQELKEAELDSAMLDRELAAVNAQLQSLEQLGAMESATQNSLLSNSAAREALSIQRALNQLERESVDPAFDSRAKSSK